MGVLETFSHNRNIRLWLFVCKNFRMILIISLAGSCFLCLISTYNSFFTENTINKCLQDHTNFQNVSSYFNSAIDDSLSGMKVSYNDRQDLYFTERDTHKLLKYTSHSLFTSEQGNFFDPTIFSIRPSRTIKNQSFSPDKILLNVRFSTKTMKQIFITSS